jgi:hypothetical protein
MRHIMINEQGYDTVYSVDILMSTRLCVISPPYETHYENLAWGLMHSGGLYWIKTN